MNFRKFPLLCAFFATISCDFFDHQVAGGGSDQPNEIVGQIKDPSGNAVARTQVVLYRQISGGSIVGYRQVDTATTDINGQFKVRPDTIGTYFGLYAVNTANKLVSTKKNIFIDSANGNNQVLTLEKGVLVQAQLSKNSLVQVDTLPIAFNVKAGSFSAVLPAGKYELLSQDNSYRPNGHLADFTGWDGDTLDLGTLSPSNSEILIDNFEDGDTRTLIGRYFQGGWWYSDAAAAQISDISKSIVSANNSKVMHVTATVTNPDYPVRYALLGFSIGAGESGCKEKAGPCFFNFNKLNSITFKAKGSGSARIQLGSKLVQASGDFNFPYVDIILENTWKEYTIPMSKFTVASNSPLAQQGVTTSQMLNGIYALSFLMMGSTDLWLDDIRLLGQTINEIEITH